MDKRVIEFGRQKPAKKAWLKYSEHAHKVRLRARVRYKFEFEGRNGVRAVAA